MYLTPFHAWLAFCSLALQVQTQTAVSLMIGTAQMSMVSTFAISAPRPRSTAKLTLVASNNWVRSHKSTARLSVVRC